MGRALVSANRELMERMGRMNMKNVNNFPPGWDEERVRRLIQHYESQTEAIA